jgi:hypothetical protein
MNGSPWKVHLNEKSSKYKKNVISSLGLMVWSSHVMCLFLEHFELWRRVHLCGAPPWCGGRWSCVFWRWWIGSITCTKDAKVSPWAYFCVAKVDQLNCKKDTTYSTKRMELCCWEFKGRWSIWWGKLTNQMKMCVCTSWLVSCICCFALLMQWCFWCFWENIYSLNYDLDK